MSSDNTYNQNVDLWSMGKCIFCKGKIGENPKILNCLHVICEDCTRKEKTESGVLCKCNMVTNGELTDYPVVSPNISQVKKCCEKNCISIVKKICMHCKSLFCKPCSKIHLIRNKDHNPVLMMGYPLKKEFIACPQCMEKCVEVYCTECSKMICPLCHLNFHRKHDFKLISEMASETKIEFETDLLEMKKNNQHLGFLMNISDDHIQKLKSHKKKINDEIDEKINLLYEEVNKRSLELKSLLETNFTNAVNNIRMNKEVLSEFIKENEYYQSLTSSIIDYNKSFEYIKLSNIIKKQMIIAKGNTQTMPNKIAKCNADLVYNDEQSIKKCVEAIQGFGDIILSPIIINKPESNTTVYTINAPQILENDQPANLSPMVDIKTEKEDNEMVIDEDADSEPLVYCYCCNQWTEELINCTNCNRFYHNVCHIPPLDKELTPKNSSLKSWKCTICHDVAVYCNDINNKNLSGHIPIGHSERKLIERILMELYCQNNDSEHYRDCLDVEMYPRYYEKIVDPISLNDIKQRLESESYTSLIDILKDMQKVFTNGKLYYCEGDPYHTSANELHITLIKLIKLWIPKLNLARLTY